jgi:hypothetical protein
MVREGSDARHGHCPETIRRDAAGWVLDALDPVGCTGSACSYSATGDWPTSWCRNASCGYGGQPADSI